MKRTFLNMSLIASLLLSPTLNASLITEGPGGGEGFWDSIGAASIQDNLKGFQEYRGANGERVYSFGGSLAIKRKKPDVPLWWHVQGPELTASCSGVSFKGMFGSIINFDELEKQFSEAGESVAFGILVGIIYSLPGVGDIFSRLDAWSKRIQAMLSNACESGIKIGEQMGNAAGDWADKKINSYTGNDTKTWTDKIGGGFGSISDGIERVLDCSESASTWIADGSCPDAQKTAKNSLVRGYFGTPSLLGAAATNFYFNNGNRFPFKTKPNEIIENDAASLDLERNAHGFYKDLALVALVTSVTGDTVLNDDSYALVSSAIKKVLSENKDKTDDDKAARKAALESLMNAMKNAKYMCQANEGNPAMINNIARFLIYGNQLVVTSNSQNSEISSSSGSSSSAAATPAPAVGEIQEMKGGQELLYMMSLPQVAAVRVEEGPMSHAFYATMLHGKGVKGDKFNSSIQNIFTEYAGVYQTAHYAKDYYLFGDQNAKEKVTYNLFNDETQKFMSKVYRNTRDSSAKMRLENIFVNYAIYHMANAIKAQLSGTLSEYMSQMYEHVPVDAGDTNINGNEEASEFISCREGVVERFRTFNEKLSKVVAEFLRDKLNGVKSPDALYAVFENQNRKNIKSALETLKRK